MKRFKSLLARVATFCLLMAATAPLAGANNEFPVQVGPCPPNGGGDPVIGTPHVIVPSDGYYWNGSKPETAGRSGNATVWTHNYDVAGILCVAAVTATTGSGDGNRCPTSGPQPAFLALDGYRTTGTGWKEDGELYLLGFWQKHYVGGYNHAFAGKCYGGAYTYYTETPYDICLTCASSGVVAPPDSDDLPILP